MSAVPVEPFFFGDRNKQLFGIYHVAAGRGDRGMGVVMCYPFGQEYLTAHRAYVLLARLLASVGCPVLRFDYYGCGDSSGEKDHGSVEQWQCDIHMAVDELVASGVADSICLLGGRLGAAMALMVALERDDISKLVLWDAVIDGCGYLQDLCDGHTIWLKGSFAKAEPSKCREVSDEVLGFPLTDLLRQEMQMMRLTAVSGRLDADVLMVESHMRTDSEALHKSLQRLGARTEVSYIPDPEPWTSQEGPISVRAVFEALRSWACVTHI